MATVVRFWGVRGSVPVSFTDKERVESDLRLLQRYRAAGCPESVQEFLNCDKEGTTHGGGTSCVEVVVGKERFVFDMGTGLRLLGNSLLPQMVKDKGLKITFCLSHVHWDHIQGLPFFAPLYVNKDTGIKNQWTFFGGTDWQKTAEVCLRGQMDPPVFPVSWKEIVAQTHKIHFREVHDLMTHSIKDSGIIFTCRKLNHPQETYGWRIEDSSSGKVVAYTTDNEPYDPTVPDPKLLFLARGADVWITDCQYTYATYHGIKTGLPKYGWGHSYPEAVAATALAAGVKKVVLFHHDPASSDDDIRSIESMTRALLLKTTGGARIEVVAAQERMEFHL